MMNYGLGCAPSVLDGTEYIADIDEKLAIPEEFSLVNAMPPVRNQGQTSTCVCQSLVSCLDFLKNEESNTPHAVNGYSIDELYGIRANKSIEGMQIKEALSYLRHHGLNGKRISSYAKVSNSERMKRCIIMFGPCVGGLPVYSQSPVYFWRNHGQFLGGHCVTFVGYNKSGLIIRNSWGISWANRGHVVIPYDEFDKCCFESWTITF